MPDEGLRMPRPEPHDPLRRRLLKLAGGGLALGGAAFPVLRAALAGPHPSLPDRTVLNASFGDIGPRLIAAGAIDAGLFQAVYRNARRPLTDSQQRILHEGSAAPIVFDDANAYFLLNLFWALGLANNNRVLTRGPMLRNGMARIPGYASTGGWTLARRPVMELYAAASLIVLDDAQQSRLTEVAGGVYRPCCDNPTSFPDCNHGMAMLGLLEVLAAHGADTAALFRAAMAANRFWFPAQTAQLALYLKAARNADYVHADPRLTVGGGLFSATGFRKVGGWLQANGLSAPPGGDGPGCAV